MKFIAEVVEHVKPIVEAAGNGSKNYMIEGVFLQAEVKNRNGRIYPFSVLEREVSRYNNEYVKQNRALGELGHPDSPHINLDRVSHMITELKSNGTDFVGKAKIMDTPFGKIVKSFIDENVRFGVSSRGVGSLESTHSGDMVGDDFYLATAADIVADPSAPEAFVRGLTEGREWVWENGVLSQRQIEQMQRTIHRAPVKTRAARHALETRVFESFMRELSKNTKVQS
jgi:hypothetical protein